MIVNGDCAKFDFQPGTWDGDCSVELTESDLARYLECLDPKVDQKWSADDIDGRVCVVERGRWFGQVVAGRIQQRGSLLSLCAHLGFT